MNTVFAKTAIEFAKFRSQAYDQYTKKFFPDGFSTLGGDEHFDAIEYARYEVWDAALNIYLDSLDYQDILDIEALMMFGRGDDSSSTFNDLRRYLSDTYPNEDGKSMAVEYIASKEPLAEYLSTGLDHLN